MSLHTKVSGTWKEVASGGGLSAKVSGAWKAIDAAYVKVSGVWKEFYVNALAVVNDSTASDTDFSNAQASIQYGNDGEVTFEGSDSDPGYTWMTAGTSDLFEIRASSLSGDTPSGSAFDTWLALSTNRGWTLAQAGSGFKTATFTVEIRLASSGDVFDSGAITMAAVVP